jgi:TRAP transporter TAXI family solute receptor
VPRLIAGSRRWLIACVLTALTLVAAVVLTGPSPPGRIILATGQAQGVYDTVGAAYREQLGRLGLRVDVVRTNGSVDNLNRLLAREVDVAFVQGGLAATTRDPRGQLRGLAALYREPLWIFYRGEPLDDSLATLERRRISIGPAGSGTEALARALFQAHGLAPAAGATVNLTNVEAERALMAGDVDVVFLVTSYRDPVVSRLVRDPVRLLGFRRDVAHASAVAGLRPVRLAEGVLDLRRNIPPSDATLLAPAALLVAREDLHGRVVEQILNVARIIHGPGSLIDPPHAFPSLDGVDFPVHEAATSWFAHGESYLASVLPYRAVRWLLILKILVFPMLLVWLPLFRILPEISTMRVNRRIASLYTMLANAERTAGRAETAEQLRACLTTLDGMSGALELLRRRLPGFHQRDLYEWRLHVSHVRDQVLARLRRLEAGSEPPKVA